MSRIERIVARAIELQGIPAPTFQEGDRSEYLIAEFAGLGYDEFELDAAGNLLIRVPGGSTLPLIVSAHMDSVIEPEAGQLATRRDGRVIGPGIGDNAVALSTLVELGDLLLGSQPPGDVWLVANVAEEGLGNLLGIQHIVERFGAHVTGYVVLEGLSLGFIYHKALPVRRFRVSATSRGGHSWSRSDRESSIHTLIELGHALLNLDLPDTPRTTLNLGKIEGGTSVNSLASRAYLEIDLRSESERIANRIARKIGKIAVGYGNGEVQISVEPIGHRPGGSLPRSHPIVRAAEAALKDAGVEDIQWSSGSTDASLPISLGLPAVCIGITRGAGAHSLDEYIEVGPIKQGLQSLLNLVEKSFSVHRHADSWVPPRMMEAAES